MLRWIGNKRGGSTSGSRSGPSEKKGPSADGLNSLVVRKGATGGRTSSSLAKASSSASKSAAAAGSKSLAVRKGAVVTLKRNCGL